MARVTTVREVLVCVGVVLAMGCGAVSAQPSKSAPPAPAPKETPKDAPKDAPKEPAKESKVLEGKIKGIDGKEVDLSAYAGKVVVIVNVASQCGFTPQYEGLEKLYKERKDKGLVVLGFPANNFGSQEPGTNAEIAGFCTSKFGVTFPMFEKVSVKGADKCPLYGKLTAMPAPIGGDPKWNFTKFVLDRSGNVVARYDAKKDLVGKADLEPELIAKVDELLKEKAK